MFKVSNAQKIAGCISGGFDVGRCIESGTDLMAKTISNLLAGVGGMLPAGEIVSVVEAKGGNSLYST